MSEYKHTALHTAAANNSVEVAQLLIDAGASIDKLDKDGLAPLHIAAENNALEIAYLLIEKGADIDVEGGLEGGIETLTGITPLRQAAWYGHTEAARLLIDAGADVKKGAPLHTAAYRNTIDVARLILKADSTTVDLIDRHGESVLHSASFTNSVDVAHLLIEHGADVHARDRRDQTLIYTTAQYNSPDVARLLIEHGADIDARDKDGRTPLYMAAWKNSLEMARLLIEHGANTAGIDLDWMDDAMTDSREKSLLDQAKQRAVDLLNTFQLKYRDNKLTLTKLESKMEQIKVQIAEIENNIELIKVYEDIPPLDPEDQDGINPEVDGDEDLSSDGLTQIAYEARMDTFIGSISERGADTNDLGDVFKEMIGDIPALTKDSPPDRYQLLVGLKHRLQVRLSVLAKLLESLKKRDARLVEMIERQMVMRNEMERRMHR